MDSAFKGRNAMKRACHDCEPAFDQDKVPTKGGIQPALYYRSPAKEQVPAVPMRSFRNRVRSGQIEGVGKKD